MVRPKQEKPGTEDAIMERMNEALKRALNTPHETNEAMVERRRRQAKRGKPPKKVDRT